MLHVAVFMACFLLMAAELTSSVNITTTTHVLGDRYVCQVWRNMSKDEICDYVNYHDDICEGGGYLLWSQYVECQFDLGKKIAVMIVGFFWMLMLFVSISSAADDFFSPCISSIVAHLKISESVAGATFMAFGNGAPDIFGSIASVLSSPKPKAGLALGELLGAGIFVTTVVVAAIIFIRPFQIDVFSTLRDLSFYLTALGYFILYAMYLITVILGHQLHKRKKRRQVDINMKTSLSDCGSKRESVPTVIPIIHISSETAEELQNTSNTANKEPSNVHIQQDFLNGAPVIINVDALNIFAGVTRNNDSGGEGNPEEEFVVSHSQVFTGPEARSRATSIVPPPTNIVSLRMFIFDIYEHLRPLSSDWSELGWFSKALSVVKMPAVFVFKLTIPLNECSWSKAVVIMQAVLAPQWFLFAFQMTMVEPFDGSPALYVYALVLSMVIVTPLAFFTSMTIQPRYYKEVASYVGFVMSLSWIYFISSEVVNVVTMFGVVSQLSHEVLGLTILAWSNSIGDLVADISVVKQGYPRMAMVAAVGGPLLIQWFLRPDLLMGFSIPFVIAIAKGKTVAIDLNPTYKVLILFLGVSLLTNLTAIFVQRFYLRRLHAFLLICIYISFIIVIILSETNEIVWS